MRNQNVKKKSHPAFVIPFQDKNLFSKCAIRGER